VKLCELDPLVNAMRFPLSSETAVIADVSGTSTAELACGIVAA
jgi:hypothetical protein